MISMSLFHSVQLFLASSVIEIYETETMYIDTVNKTEVSLVFVAKVNLLPWQQTSACTILFINVL